MKNKNNSKISAILVLTLLLMSSAFIASTQLANAHTPAWTIPTWSYISVTPNTIGVNQDLMIFMWLNLPPPTAYGQYGDRWEGFEVTVTKPDGSIEKLGPFSSDPVGSQFATYRPTQTGVYSFQFSFPGQTLAGDNPPLYPNSEVWVNDIYQPSESSIVTVTVTNTPREGWPETPLPTDYWARPVNAINRAWYQISGNWLGYSGGNVNLYSEGPETAHILWTRPITFGGLAGGSFGEISYYDGLSYESKFPTPVIIQGILYYNEYPTPRYAVDKYPPGFYAVDLRTGEVLWWKNDTISFGEILDWESPNQHGTMAYLWKVDGSTWKMFDAFNGNDLVTIRDVPSGTRATAPDGTPLIYQLNAARGWLALWNSSKAVQYPLTQAGSNYYFNWRPQPGQMINGSWGYQWNITLSDHVPNDSYITGIDSDIMLLTSGLATGPGGVGTGLTPETYVQSAISLKQGEEGTLLWTKEYQAPPGNVTITSGPVGEGVFTLRSKETMQWYGYDLKTGELLWGPTEPQGDWDVYGMGGTIAYGKLLSCGYGGVLYAYDIKTGDRLWSYVAEGIGFESYYGNYPLSVSAVADEKVYLYSSEHSPSKPQWRGSMIRCVDINTGAEVWTIDTWGSGALIADGYFVTLNNYDNQIYCYGKGKTEITVTAPQGVITKGSSAIIIGNIKDMSPGAKGTPAIADEHMTQWMEYLYMQQPIPGDATGVPVKLTAIGEDGSTHTIGTATSDMSGMFSMMWTPPAEGKYTIVASFEGSKSYWPSYAETAIGVTASQPDVSGPTPTQAVNPTGSSDASLYIAIAAAVVIIAVIAAAIALRRRK